MTEHVLTLRELNRAVLARQLLLRRVRLPVAKAVERVAALQAQWPPSPYIALWSRLEGFRRESLARALTRRAVVKASLMRITLHIVSAPDYLLFAGALKESRAREMERRLARHGLAVDIAGLAEKAIALTTEAPRSRPQLLEMLTQERPRAGDERPWVIWTLLQTHADLVHAPGSAAWRKTTGRADFVAARAWLGASPDSRPDAVQHLVRRYLGAFGPASKADIASWTGLTAAALAPALQALEPRTRTFRDEKGRLLIDLPRGPLSGGGVEPPVRFLPKWDSLLLGYAPPERERVLPEQYRRAVIKVNGDVLETFLVDGFVAGVWRVERARDRADVVLEPFEPLPRRVRKELEDEAGRLVRFVEPDAGSYAVRLAGSA